MICPQCRKRYVHERCYDCNPVVRTPEKPKPVAQMPTHCPTCGGALPAYLKTAYCGPGCQQEGSN